MWTDIVTAVSAVVTLPIVLGAAVLAIRQLRDSTQTRHAQIVLDLMKHWDEQPLQDARNAWSGKKPEELKKIVTEAFDRTTRGTSSASYHKATALPDYFETIGTLHLKTSAFPIEVIDTLWGDFLLDAWSRWEPAAKAVRKKQVSPAQVESGRPPWGNFELLARRIERHQAREEAGSWWRRARAVPAETRRLSAAKSDRARDPS